MQCKVEGERKGGGICMTMTAVLLVCEVGSSTPSVLPHRHDSSLALCSLFRIFSVNAEASMAEQQ